MTIEAALEALRDARDLLTPPEGEDSAQAKADVLLAIEALTKPCEACGGKGVVPDITSASGEKVCLCWRTQGRVPIGDK